MADAFHHYIGLEDYKLTLYIYVNFMYNHVSLVNAKPNNVTLVQQREGKVGEIEERWTKKKKKEIKEAARERKKDKDNECDIYFTFNFILAFLNESNENSVDYLC